MILEPMDWSEDASGVPSLVEVVVAMATAVVMVMVVVMVMAGAGRVEADGVGLERLIISRST